MELIPSSDGPWGGESVCDEFIRFLSELVGQNAMDQLKENHPEDYIEICRSFKEKYKRAPLLTDGKTIVILPQSYFHYGKTINHVKEFKELIEKSDYKNTIELFSPGRLKFQNSLLKSFFKKTIDSIVKHIDENLVKDVGTIVLVGGFSECGLLQKTIREFFKGKKIIKPDEAGLATLKGAVYFGHIPEAISRRSAMYSYGIQTWLPFDKKHHPENKKAVLAGTRCKDVFFTFVQKGESIYSGFTKSQIFYTLEPIDRVECHVYLSDLSNPRFIDDESSRQLGILEIQLPELKNRSRREIRETMTFGETNLKVEAEDLFTGIVSEITFDFDLLE